MFKSFKYRLLPNNKQKVLLNKHFGCVRFVYNLALETKTSAYIGNRINLSCFDLNNQLPELKKECEWLKEVNSQSLQQSITHLETAFTKFYKGKSNFPNFKNKSSKNSFNIPKNVIISSENNKLIIPKFKKGIDIVLHRPINGTIKSATISKTQTGKYFVSILVNTNVNIPLKQTIKEKTTIGIDLGIKYFVVTSIGQKIDNPKYFKKLLNKLQFINRKYSKYKGKRTKQKLALLHEKAANQRKDFLHKTSIQLIKNHDNVAIENLNISKMLQDKNLSQSISDVGWGMFIEMLKYKAEWYGKNILQIGRFEPSSKLCSCCGYINKELKLSDREWTCPKCKSILNRDINAAINIKNFALKNHLCKGLTLKNQKELPTLVGVLTSEIS